MAAATTCAWESDRTPDEVVAALRSASEGARSSFGGSGVSARCVGRHVLLRRRTAEALVTLDRPVLLARVEPRGSGSRIEGRFWFGPMAAVLRQLGGSRLGGAHVEAMRRHVEVVCDARPVDVSER